MEPSAYDVSSLIASERLDLSSVGALDFDVNNLVSSRDVDIEELLVCSSIESRWKQASVQLDRFKIPDGTGGVNPGDQRAIFYLIAGLKPKSVLEIGTHIGASTVNIACALRDSVGKDITMVTVDEKDVNCRKAKPWLSFGAKFSPQYIVDSLAPSFPVQFVIDNSLGFLLKSRIKFDFIFLDGDHSASSAYQDISVALRCLAPGGVILLHDFFPGGKSLWSDGTVIPGPFLAMERIIHEGVNVSVKPLGRLPWPTKFGSSSTSLALVLGQ